MMQVLQLGRFVMLMPKENINDGEDDADLDPRLYANRSVPTPDTTPQQTAQ
jgi:hypothetical protein